MTDSVIKDQSVEKVTSSVSNVKIGVDAEKTSASIPVTANNDIKVESSASKSFDESNLQLGGNPIGNLNLPHVQPASHKNSATKSVTQLAASPSHVIEKTGNHSSLEDLEILSTIGKFVSIPQAVKIIIILAALLVIKFC